MAMGDPETIINADLGGTGGVPPTHPDIPPTSSTGKEHREDIEAQSELTRAIRQGFATLGGKSNSEAPAPTASYTLSRDRESRAQTQQPPPVYFGGGGNKPPTGTVSAGGSEEDPYSLARDRNRRPPPVSPFYRPDEDRVQPVGAGPVPTPLPFTRQRAERITARHFREEEENRSLRRTLSEEEPDSGQQEEPRPRRRRRRRPVGRGQGEPGGRSGGGGGSGRVQRSATGGGINNQTMYYALRGLLPSAGGAAFATAGESAGRQVAGLAGLGGVGSAALGLGAAAGGAALGYSYYPRVQGWFAEREPFRQEYVESRSMAAKAAAFQGKGPEFGVPAGTDPRGIVNEFDAKKVAREKDDIELLKKERDEIKTKYQGYRSRFFKSKEDEEEEAKLRKAWFAKDEEVKKAAETRGFDQSAETGGKVSKSGVPDDVISLKKEDLDVEQGGMGYLGLLGATLRKRGYKGQPPELDSESDRYHRWESDAELDRRGQDASKGGRKGRPFGSPSEKDIGELPLHKTTLPPAHKETDASVQARKKEIEDALSSDKLEAEMQEYEKSGRGVDQMRFYLGSHSYGVLTQ